MLESMGSFVIPFTMLSWTVLSKPLNTLARFRSTTGWPGWPNPRTRRTKTERSPPSPCTQPHATNKNLDVKEKQGHAHTSVRHSGNPVKKNSPNETTTKKNHGWNNGSGEMKTHLDWRRERRRNCIKEREGRTNLGANSINRLCLKMEEERMNECDNNFRVIISGTYITAIIVLRPASVFCD